jgi:hypothetical protein
MVVFKKIHQMESMVEAGQSTIDSGSRVSFKKVFDSCESPFLFLVFLSLDASKQCRDWLGVGFVLSVHTNSNKPPPGKPFTLLHLLYSIYLYII